MRDKTKHSAAEPKKPSHREKIAQRYAKRDSAFHALVEDENLRIHTCTTISAEAGPFLDNIYFIGVDGIFCKQGSWRLSFKDHDPITLAADEFLLAFPGHVASFEALDCTQTNILNYAVLAGSFAEEFVASLGYYDFLKTPWCGRTKPIMRGESLSE